MRYTKSRDLVRLMLLLLAASVMAVQSPPPISLTVSPRYSFAPTTIRATIRISQHPDNRAFCVWIASATHDTNSCRDLEGENDRITRDIVFRHPPPGDYIAQARLLRSTGWTQLSQRVEFQVIESIPGR